MIRLDAVKDDERVLIAVSVDGELRLVTPSDDDAVDALRGLGVDDPAPLVASCRQWGAVEIHETEMRDTRDDFT